MAAQRPTLNGSDAPGSVPILTAMVAARPLTLTLARGAVPHSGLTRRAGGVDSPDGTSLHYGTCSEMCEMTKLQVRPGPVGVLRDESCCYRWCCPWPWWSGRWWTS